MDLDKLEITVLVDMLAQYTSFYTKMITDPASENEVAIYKLKIKAIQAEIDLRKRTAANTSTTDPDIVLPDQ